ncbi:hypothetical protein [Dyella terrae]|uniref:hypothetical protein n=1 Tax=Dyella terrae TaxID=522259 RepID=UPI001EFD819E|nr:hypothetical protein [Dyella terrae]ULU23787.1 hypothetical protein DYST_00685 [Dyella terrae]
MRKMRKHASFTADHAIRMALGAYYNARAARPLDGAAMVGAWMLEISRKLAGDDITRGDYAEIIGRWNAEQTPLQNRV